MSRLIDNDAVHDSVDEHRSILRGHGLLRMGRQLICPGLPGQQREIGAMIAASFNAIDPSRWLAPLPDMRLRMQTGQFTLLAKHALTFGVVHTTPNMTAAAVWLPVHNGAVPPPPDDYDERLREICDDAVHHDRFRRLDEAMDTAHHAVTGPHWYLPFLAVSPRYQGTGLGSELLLHQHRLLDGQHIRAFLIAADVRSRALYARHGYRDHGQPIRAASDAPWMYPMIREPGTPLDSYRTAVDQINDMVWAGADPGPGRT